MFLFQINAILFIKEFWWILIFSFLLQDDGPTARDLMIRYSTGKKSCKDKKKLEKAMKVLKVSNLMFHNQLIIFFVILV